MHVNVINVIVNVEINPDARFILYVRVMKIRPREREREREHFSIIKSRHVKFCIIPFAVDQPARIRKRFRSS